MIGIIFGILCIVFLWVVYDYCFGELTYEDGVEAATEDVAEGHDPLKLYYALDEEDSEFNRGYQDYLRELIQKQK